MIGTADRDDLYDIGAEAGKTLRREVNIRRMTRAVWEQAANDGFRRTVDARATVPLFERRHSA